MERPSLSRRQKKELEQIVRNLYAYYNTPEGQAFGERLEKILQRIHSRPPEITLSEREYAAYFFIKSKRETRPSIREITRHLGLKSSRSGFRVVQTLIQKGILKKDGRELQTIDSVAIRMVK